VDTYKKLISRRATTTFGMANSRHGFTRLAPSLVSSARLAESIKKRPRSSIAASGWSLSKFWLSDGLRSLGTSITLHGRQQSPFSTAANRSGETPNNINSFPSSKEEDDIPACSSLKMTTETQALAEILLSHEKGNNLDDSTFSASLWKHRAALSKAITLIESRASDRQLQASLLLTHLLRHSNNESQQDHHSSFRIGM
jgi:hypothetical protein